MILERALFHIRPGSEADFEAAFGEAKEQLAAAAGFQSVALGRGIEHPSTYQLLVHWDQLSDHTEGFRGSEAFLEWRRLLSPFFDTTAPEVEHYEPLLAP
jgi:heme-degrading monooxygenase HmoA